MKKIVQLLLLFSVTTVFASVEHISDLIKQNQDDKIVYGLTEDHVKKGNYIVALAGIGYQLHVRNQPYKTYGFQDEAKVIARLKEQDS